MLHDSTSDLTGNRCLGFLEPPSINVIPDGAPAAGLSWVKIYQKVTTQVLRISPHVGDFLRVYLQNPVGREHGFPRVPFLLIATAFSTACPDSIPARKIKIHLPATSSFLLSVRGYPGRLTDLNHQSWPGLRITTTAQVLNLPDSPGATS